MIAIKKVMVADDDPAILDFISIMLEFKGFTVRTTHNSTTLFNMEDDVPDLLLLDIWMSGIDGRDICKKLKGSEKTKKIPIIMISASKDIEDSARAAGADDFLAKPFEINELLQKIIKNIS